jgi:hypothetical protein
MDNLCETDASSYSYDDKKRGHALSVYHNQTSAAKIQHKGVTLYNNQKYDDNSIWWEIYDRHIRGTSIYDEALLIMD